MKRYNLSHRLIIGDSQKMPEIEDSSIGLVVTSPPYYKMRGEMEYKDFNEYMNIMENVFREVYRVLKYGRVCVVNVSNYMEDGVRYPIPAYITLMLLKIGFTFMEDIDWIKPEGFGGAGANRIVHIHNKPFPFYYYPSWIRESIIVVSKGKMCRPPYDLPCMVESEINMNNFKDYLTDVWRISPDTNNEHCATFPLILPHNIITFYSYVSDIVLDPFVGSGTTMLEARKLRRSSVIIDINKKYIPLIKKKVNWGQNSFSDNIEYELIIRGE